MRFKTLYADPPWHFNDKLDPTRRKPYDTLTLDDLMELPVNRLMTTHAHIYMWSTSSHIHEALHLMDAWGFNYKTIIPWIKKTKDGKIHFGMGHYFRAAHEPCLFGVKGNLSTETKNTRNVLIAKMPERHSGKPPEMYRLIEKNSLGPYLELFSRVNRKGWVMVGDEIDGQDIRETLRLLVNAETPPDINIQEAPNLFDFVAVPPTRSNVK